MAQMLGLVPRFAGLGDGSESCPTGKWDIHATEGGCDASRNDLESPHYSRTNCLMGSICLMVFKRFLERYLGRPERAHSVFTELLLLRELNLRSDAFPVRAYSSAGCRNTFLAHRPLAVCSKH